MIERCNYSKIKKLFPWITEYNKKCVISPDLDGLLTSILLSNFLDWQVVGVYTINDLWLSKNHIDYSSKQSPEELIISNKLIFVDHDIYRRDAEIRRIIFGMIDRLLQSYPPLAGVRGWKILSSEPCRKSQFVNLFSIYRKNIFSVGHHLLQWSNETPIPQHTTNNNSLNPNLLRGITKKEFNRKYPYGTFHFLLACFSAWGFLKDFDPDDEVATLLLHIDSSFESSIKYQDNAIDWLDWLGGSEDKSPLYPICRRMLKFNPRTIIERFKILANQFEQFGLPPRRQATFDNPSDETKWVAIKKLIKWFEEKTGWESKIIEFPAEKFIRYGVKRESNKPNKEIFESIIRRDPFSYAIIAGGGDDGFNYGWLEAQSL